ncbi:CorA family divalent cation transporter [Thalassospira sp.]|uniref:CorA family divalent cation transporter n=1 Tax=Thalassospira sp. TaxID=1912094 RepID=UPI000C3F9277|nr:CorA family divalent cation transporter [Thalassospira sp.]MBC05168.1 zinc transporter ZntB [Thalassospira sp.]|tara:strand:+ start:12724 stop:13713 length:990 start_codon:yes stop_codon:yes gene_type:complete
MSKTALINAFEITPSGTAQAVGWDALQTGLPEIAEGNYLWVHLDWMGDGVRDWLINVAGIDATITDTLSTRGTRPAVFFYDPGYSLNLRGVNLNAENDPADMISVRFWVTNNMVITLRNQPLKAFDDMRAAIAEGKAPNSIDDFVLTVAERLAYRVENVVRGMEDEVEALEDDQESVAEGKTLPLRKRGSDIRHMLSRLRRHLGPQRDALANYVELKPAWSDKRFKRRARALTDKTVRLVEEFDSLRERLQIVNENLMAIESEQMNRTMYWLTVIAGLFLPISFVTGLLGINVGGVPATDSPYGFVGVSIILAVITAFEIWLFKKMRLI